MNVLARRLERQLFSTDMHQLMTIIKLQQPKTGGIFYAGDPVDQKKEKKKKEKKEKEAAKKNKVTTDPAEKDKKEEKGKDKKKN